MVAIEVGLFIRVRRLEYGGVEQENYAPVLLRIHTAKSGLHSLFASRLSL